MPRILNLPEVKEADRLTLAERSVSSLELMEHASAVFCAAFLQRFPNPGPGLVVCGPGNNGGDGLAIARLLHASGIPVQVVLTHSRAQLSPDALSNAKRLPKSIPVLKCMAEALASRFSEFSWLCDAVLGSGINRPLGPDVQPWVQAMNAFPGLRISVDMPTGLLNEMPADALSFSAHWTGTFHSPKLAFMFPSSQSRVGQFSVLDIGLTEPPAPRDALFWLDGPEIRSRLKVRKRFSHKGTFGHALLLAGSEGKMGAALLATRALLRTGVGLATLYGPRCGRDVVQASVPEAMYLSDPEKEWLSEVPPLGKYQAIGIGPGIGTHRQTASVVQKVLKRCVSPVVLDADALNLLAENPGLIKVLPEGSILTPHPKEFERLAGKSGTDYEVFQKAKAFSRDHQLVLVLKGAYTLICSPDGRSWFNSTGNPGMATGGSGDVLTGMLTSLLAQGYAPLDAALCGVYLHGLAGDLALEAESMESLLPSDLIACIGKAFKKGWATP
jgi:ADP-dependent NAD(P)H-hydrate dehydratase / NAD(P)H-hydrate epimerase